MYMLRSLSDEHGKKKQNKMRNKNFPAFSMIYSELLSDNDKSQRSKTDFYFIIIVVVTIVSQQSVSFKLTEQLVHCNLTSK